MSDASARTPEQLRALSEHVLYEVQMLFAMTNHLREDYDGTVPLPWAVKDACIESFAIHTRVLYEFLWHDPKPRSKHDDGFASEYFPPGVWEDLRDRVQKSALDGLWERTGGELAHLSYKRTTLAQEARVWEFDVVAMAFGMAFRLFLENVDPQIVIPDFESKMRASWHAPLNWPAATGYIVDANPRSVATDSPQDMSQVRVVPFEELLP